MLVDDEKRCAYYQQNSNNVKAYGECTYQPKAQRFTPGEVVGLWNRELKTFFRMTNHGQLDQNPREDGRIPPNWAWERFRVVDVGSAQFALFSVSHTRFLQVVMERGGYEVAKGRPTTQSSTGFGGNSERAVDGNTNQDWGGGSCTHTAAPNGWWEVDLGAKYPIDRVVVWNRQGYGDRLGGAVVTVDNSTCGTASSASTSDVSCNGKSGQFVRIAQPSNYLTLCEVRVFTTQNTGGTLWPDKYHLVSALSGDLDVSSALTQLDPSYRFEAVKNATADKDGVEQYSVYHPATKTWLRSDPNKKSMAAVLDAGADKIPDDVYSQYRVDVPVSRDLKPITKDECMRAGLTWTERSWGLAPPECKKTEWSRDNHLGNGPGGWDTSYNWYVDTHHVHPSHHVHASNMLRTAATDPTDGCHRPHRRMGLVVQSVRVVSGFSDVRRAVVCLFAGPYPTWILRSASSVFGTIFRRATTLAKSRMMRSRGSSRRRSRMRKRSKTTSSRSRLSTTHIHGRPRCGRM